MHYLRWPTCNLHFYLSATVHSNQSASAQPRTILFMTTCMRAVVLLRSRLTVRPLPIAVGSMNINELMNIINDIRESATIFPRPCKLTFDLLTLKVVCKSRVTWAPCVPMLVFLGHSVLELFLMYATDRRQTASSLNAPRLGHNNCVTGSLTWPQFTNTCSGHGSRPSKHRCLIDSGVTSVPSFWKGMKTIFAE